jgi:hypothetical protein
MADMTGPERTASRPGLVAKAAAWEAGVWRSLFRWVRRRPIGVEPSDATFGYSSAAAPILWVFIVMSAVEIPLLHLVIPWPTVQVIFLVLGAWGLFWMVGLLASYHVHPHVIGEQGVRVRNSLGVDVQIPWAGIRAIRPHRRTLASSKTVQVEPGTNGVVAHVAVSSMTNVEIELAEPMMLDLPAAGDEPVAVLRCYADDAAGFVARGREQLARLDRTG